MELEHGLIRGSYDLAVHSLKDMPTTLPETLSLTGIIFSSSVNETNSHPFINVWKTQVKKIHIL